MERITHELVQKSPEWLLYRATHNNASDAAAMLNCSPHKTRAQLMHERYLGMQPEFSQYVQEVVLEPGNEFESLARPLAEKIMGVTLYPATMSYGRLSASLDGLDFMVEQVWEHKRLSRELAEIMVEPFTDFRRLPKYHRVQVEQQYMVTDATKGLFSATKWNGDQLLDERHAWTQPDFDLREEILAGWVQFEIDLANYVPKVEPAKVVGKTMESLPSLFVMVEGKVTESNLDDWKGHAISVIRSVNRDLNTDQDFATADNMVKWCERAETACDVATEYTLSQTKTIADALKAIADVKAEARTCRLELDKLVKARKVSRKEEIVGGAVADWHKYVADLNTGLSPYSLPVIATDFAAQVQRKSSFKSMQDGVDAELARAKIAATTLSDAMKARRKLIDSETEFAFLFNDAATLIQKDTETVALLIRTRISDHKAAKAAEEEATRARIAAEEKAKAEAAAREQAAEILRQEREAQEARDRQEKAEADAQAERERQEAEDRRRHDEESERERAQAETDLHSLGQSGAPDASQAAESIVSSSLESYEQPRGTGRLAPGYSGVTREPVSAPATIQAAVADVAATLAADAPANANLGKIAECLGFRLDEAFIVDTLGVPWRRKEKSARFWSEGDYDLIRLALIKHLRDNMATGFVPF